MPDEVVEFPTVTIRQGPRSGSVFPLPVGLTAVGRDRGRGLMLDDPSVSFRHAEFRRVGDQITVRDAGSLNGTYVNGLLCKRITVLADGDQVWIGRFHLIFRDRAVVAT